MVVDDITSVVVTVQVGHESVRLVRLFSRGGSYQDGSRSAKIEWRKKGKPRRRGDRDLLGKSYYNSLRLQA